MSTLSTTVAHYEPVVLTISSFCAQELGTSTRMGCQHLACLPSPGGELESFPLPPMFLG